MPIQAAPFPATRMATACAADIIATETETTRPRNSAGVRSFTTVLAITKALAAPTPMPSELSSATGVSGNAASKAMHNPTTPIPNAIIFSP